MRECFEREEMASPAHPACVAFLKELAHTDPAKPPLDRIRLAIERMAAAVGHLGHAQSPYCQGDLVPRHVLEGGDLVLVKITRRTIPDSVEKHRNNRLGLSAMRIPAEELRRIGWFALCRRVGMSPVGKREHTAWLAHRGDITAKFTDEQRRASGGSFWSNVGYWY